MIYVPVPKEIKEYEKKIFKNLTVRQLLSLIVGVILGVSTFALCRFVIGLNSDIISYIVIVIVIPCFLTGFIKIQDMPFDKYAKIKFFHITHKQKLIYDNGIRFMTRKDDEDDDVQSKKSKSKKRKRQKIKEKI